MFFNVPFLIIFPGWGLCMSNVILPLTNETLDPDVFPLFSSSNPNEWKRRTNSSNVKSFGIALNRFLNFSVVLIYEYNAKILKLVLNFKYIRSVEEAVGGGFKKVAGKDGPRILSGGVNERDGFKVCYGSGDSYYTAECPGGEAAPFHDFSENILAGVIEMAEYFHLSRRHFAVTEYPDIFKSFPLYFPCFQPL